MALISLNNCIITIIIYTFCEADEKYFQRNKTKQKNES